MVESSNGGWPDRIKLSGISATGYHGVFPHERRDGQPFSADVTLHVDTRPAAEQDRFDLTVDYGALAERVAAILAGEPADLIETVAERIAALALSDDRVGAVDVVVHKPQAPVAVPVADVSVEIHRDRIRMPATRLPGGGSGTAVFPIAGFPEPEVPAFPEPEPMPAFGGSGFPEAEAPAFPEPEAPAPAEPDSPESEPPSFPSASPSMPIWDPVQVAPAPVPTPLPPLAGPVPPIAAAPVPPIPAPTPTVSGFPEPGGFLEPNGPRTIDEAAPAGPDSLVGPRDRLDLAPDGEADVVLSLGSNVGSSQETLRQAIEDLAAVEGLAITAVGPLARTAPVSGPEQQDFLNTVLLGRTRLSPRALLRACQAVEDRHGRQRDQHWGPRTLDVDLITYGSVVAVADDLELPHPRANQRAFVLQPWSHLDPEAVLPGLGGGPVAALGQTAPDVAGIRWMALDWWAPEAKA